MNIEIHNNLDESEYKNREIIKSDKILKTCPKCNSIIKPFMKDENGKKIDCRHRIYCLICSPVGTRRLCGRPSKFYEKGSFTKYSEPGQRIKLKVDRICKSCGKIFNQSSRNNECSTCRSKERRIKNKADALQYKGEKCQICGYDKCKQALEFHHLDPNTKEILISNNWDKSLELLKSELDKCILVCANCHREIHYKSDPS